MPDRQPDPVDLAVAHARIDALAARARAIYAELGKTVELSGNGGASGGGCGCN